MKKKIDINNGHKTILLKEIHQNVNKNYNYIIV